MHARAQLRAAIATALSGLATPLAVYTERSHRLGPENLPAILFSLTGDTAQADQRGMGAPMDVERDQTLALEFHAAGPDGATVADTLDQLELEAEAALEAAWSAWGILEQFAPQDSEIEMNSDQEQILGVRTTQYVLTWRAPMGAPDNPEG